MLVYAMEEWVNYLLSEARQDSFAPDNKPDKSEHYQGQSCQSPRC